MLLQLSCQESKQPSADAFIFLERNGYTIDSYDGISVYRLDDTGAIMDGYYVISNEFGKSEEFQVTKGVLNGLNITFHNNNEVYSKTLYKNGRRHGMDSTFYTSGKLQRVHRYDNGSPVGPIIEYFESGQKQTESKIKNEVIVAATSYDLLGNIVSQQFIRDGRTITQHIDHGKITFEHIKSNYDDFDAMKFFDSEGQLEKFLRLHRNGDDTFLIELDEDENEITRINTKKEPHKMQEFLEYLSRLQ